MPELTLEEQLAVPVRNAWQAYQAEAERFTNHRDTHLIQHDIQGRLYPYEWLEVVHRIRFCTLDEKGQKLVAPLRKAFAKYQAAVAALYQHLPVIGPSDFNPDGFLYRGMILSRLIVLPVANQFANGWFQFLGCDDGKHRQELNFAREGHPEESIRYALNGVHCDPVKGKDRHDPIILQISVSSRLYERMKRDDTVSPGYPVIDVQDIIGIGQIRLWRVEAPPAQS